MDSIGSGLALEFLNTRAGSQRGKVDPLDGGPQLRAWLADAGLLAVPGVAEEVRSPPVARLVGEEARRLRAAILELFEAYRESTPAPGQAVHAVNRVLAAGLRSESLGFADGGFTRSSVERADLPLGLLAPIARSAAHVVTDVEPARLRPCAAVDCETWFVDTSKGGRRRWCSMARCGNRTKAARHRRKTKRRARS